MDLVAAMIFPEIRPTTRGRKFIREREGEEKRRDRNHRFSRAFLLGDGDQSGA